MTIKGGFCLLNNDTKPVPESTFTLNSIGMDIALLLRKLLYYISMNLYPAFFADGITNYRVVWL